MAVTNVQVQASLDQDVRPMCNELVKLLQRINMFIASKDDIGAYLSGVNNFVDIRQDAAHQALGTDWLAFVTIATVYQKLVAGTATTQDVTNFVGQWPIVLKLCTRDLTGI